MLYLPEKLPAVSILLDEAVAVKEYVKGQKADCASGKMLRILFLNIMPQKLVTELDIARVLALPDLDVQLIPMKISGQIYKTTPIEHMDRFYTDFEDLETDYYDGLIVTGAPIEHLPFEEVRYWKQLCHIMEWAKTHVKSTLYICWGAQAGLYYHYGIPKYQLSGKLFGIYPQKVLTEHLSLLEGLSPIFPMPNSRHTEVRRSDFQNASVQIVAEGEESGISIALDHDGREIFVTGHLEYEPYTLHNEYVRDVNKGLPIAPPKYYYVSDNPDNGVDFSWKKAARVFYHNWLTYYVNR